MTVTRVFSQSQRVDRHPRKLHRPLTFLDPRFRSISTATLRHSATYKTQAVEIETFPTAVAPSTTQASPRLPTLYVH